MFDILLLTCLSLLDTHAEKGVKVRVSRQQNEVFLLFPIDNDVIRDVLGINGPICDLLIFHASMNKKVLCLVELKGGDIRRAIQQIVNTKSQLKRFFNDSFMSNARCRSEINRVTWKACIRFSGSAPQEIKSLYKDIESAFGRGNWNIQPYRPPTARDSNEDISSFVRS